MSRWRQIQKELMAKAIRGEKLGIVQQDVAVGRIYGTIYRKPNTQYSKAALLVHCLSTNRYALGVLAKRLVEYGVLCLSIDLPSHYLNPNALTLGEISEAITESVLFLKNSLGVKRVAVIAHSIAALGALYAHSGYTKQIESYLDTTWKRLLGLFAEHSKVLESAPLSSGQLTEAKLNAISAEIEKAYDLLKQFIYRSLVAGINEHSGITCYVFLAAPLSMKNAVPGLSIFRNLPPQFRKLVNSSLSKRVAEVVFLHHRALAESRKEGNPGKYEPKKEPSYFHLYFFKTQEAYEFLRYFLNMKEPADFFQLIQSLIQFRHKENRINFFEYYLKKYLLAKPKLFIYGRRDIFLRPFWLHNRERLEDFYKKWGEAGSIKTWYGPFSHIMDADPKKQSTFLAVKDEAATEQIMTFLDGHL